MMSLTWKLRKLMIIQRMPVVKRWWRLSEMRRKLFNRRNRRKLQVKIIFDTQFRFVMKETMEEAEVEEQEKVTEEEEEVPADNKTSNEEPEVVPEEVENEPEVVAEEVKKEPEVEAMKDTKPVTEKEISKPTAVKSVEDVDTKLGNWFNKEIRSMIHTTPKGWELRGAG